MYSVPLTACPVKRQGQRCEARLEQPGTSGRFKPGQCQRCDSRYNWQTCLTAFFLKLLQVGVASTKRKPLQTIQAGHHSTNNYGWNRAQMPSSAHVDFRRCWLIAEHETRSSTERVAYRVFKNLQPFRLLILRPVHHIYSLSKFKNARPLTLWVKKCQVFHKIVSHKISCGGFFDNNLSTNNKYII